MTMHLTGPHPVFADCNLWLAGFEPETSDSLPKQLSELPVAQMSGKDFLRWQRFRPLEKKRQFLNSRLAVRAILQKELGEFAARVHLETNTRGEPILRSSQADLLPQISLTHSGTVVAVAISHGENPVGVDIEVVQPLRTDALWRSIAHPGELRSWHNQGEMSDPEALRTLWTIKESVWKSLGGCGEISISEIVIDRQGGVFCSKVPHPCYAVDEFRTKLFTVQCQEVFPQTMRLDHFGAGTVALRGSVTQWIPARPRNAREAFVCPSE